MKKEFLRGILILSPLHLICIILLSLSSLVTYFSLKPFSFFFPLVFLYNLYHQKICAPCLYKGHILVVLFQILPHFHETCRKTFYSSICMQKAPREFLFQLRRSWTKSYLTFFKEYEENVSIETTLIYSKYKSIIITESFDSK